MNKPLNIGIAGNIGVGKTTMCEKLSEIFFLEPIYESVIEFSGATAVPTPLLEERDFSFDAGAVLEQITPNTRLLILNSPANPTGGAVPRAEIDKLVAGLVECPQVAVLSDEIYLEYDRREGSGALFAAWWNVQYEKTIIS